VKAHLDVLRNNTGLNPCNPMSSSKYKVIQQHISISTSISSYSFRESKRGRGRERELYAIVPWIV
jgi:hypothetical protein